MGIGWEVLGRIASPGTFLATQLRNLNQIPVPNGGASFDGGYYDYFSNSGTDNTGLQAQTEYATSWQVDRAIEFFQSIGVGQRGFCLLATNACHSPFGVNGSGPEPGRDFPPAALVSTQEYSEAVWLASQGSLTTTWPQYMASLEALDAELGRLLAGIPMRVRSGLSILVLGDNGVEPSIADGRLQWGKDFGPDWNRLLDDYGTDRLKGSVHHWGSTTCAFWSGPGRRTRVLPTAGTATWAMLDIVDVAATAADYFGVKCAPGDGVSFLPVVYEGVAPREHARQQSFEEFWPRRPHQIQTGDGPGETAGKTPR
jgi:arylsulfatase A-like enzyme